jgi:2-keto-3-deoxy-6-phosphogluconate aldolase
MARFLIYPYNEGCNAKMTSSATPARCNVEEVAFAECLLVAIRRWITPEESEPVTGALIAACFGAIEIPPNSPNPYASIRRLSQSFGSETLIGAGTIMSAVEVGRVCEAGRNLFVMSHADPEVNRAAKAATSICLPAVVTPTGGFTVLRAHADRLKLFPAEAHFSTLSKRGARRFPLKSRFRNRMGSAPTYPPISLQHARH